MKKIKIAKRIPRRLWKYFWDIDVKKLNPAKKPYFVISRLLDKGDVEAVKWVRENFKEDKIKETFKKIRGFNPKVGSFWSLFLHIPKEQVKCLNPSYLKGRRSHWPY